MRTIEQAIRHALQKIDSANPTLRNKLYQTAWQTHEKMLVELANVTEDEKQQRRNALKNIIQTVETEFQISAQSVMAAPIATPSPLSPQHHAVNVSSTPHHPQPIAQSSMVDPNLIAPARHGNRQGTARQKKTLSLRGNGFLLVLIAILLFVAWSFYNSLMTTSPPALSDDTSPSLTELIEQDTLEKLGALPQREETAPTPTREWVRIFDPANIAAIRTRGAARVQLHENEGENFIHLTTQGREDGIILELDSGVMMQAQGRGAIFNMTVRSAMGQLAQLSVACDFGTVAACGRWRFELPPMREDLLFGIDIIGNTIGTRQTDSALTLSLALSGEVSDGEYIVDIFGLEVSFDD